MQKRRILRAAALLLALLFACLPLAACAKTHDPLTVTAFLELTVGKKDLVTASVTLGLSDVQDHEGERAYICEIRPGQELNAKTLSKKHAIAEAKIASSMKFKFDLYDGNRSRLYSGFVACYEDGTPINEIPKMIDNPSFLSRDVTAPLWENTPKGLSVTDANTASALGTAHALIDVDLAVLANHDKEGDAHAYTFAGKLYYLSAIALAALDAQIYTAYHAGMQVTLRVHTVENDLSEQPAQAMLLRTALLAFLTERYDHDRYGIVSALLIDANLPVNEVAHLGAVAQCALLSNISAGRVYISCPSTILSDALDFSAQIGTRLRGHAQFDWGLAVHLDPTVKTPWDTQNASTITPDTLKHFTGELSKISNNPLYFAVCDITFSAKDPTLQAVAFAYTYAKAAAVDANLIFYGSQKDDGMGIFAADGTARPITDMFRNVDTGLDSDQLHTCRQFSEEIAEMLSHMHVSRRVIKGTGNLSTGSGKKEALFDFTTGNRYDFSAVGGSDMLSEENPKIYQSGTYNNPVLYTWLNTAHPQTGVRKILSSGEALRDATSVSMHLLAQYNAADVQSCTLTLQLQGLDENGMPLHFEARMSAPVRAWQSVNFNVSAFTSAADLSSPVIMTLLVSADGSDETLADENFGFWIRDIHVHYPKNDYAVFFAILGAVVVGAASFILIFWLYRRTRRRARR